jgi:hypothetical protein
MALLAIWAAGSLGMSLYFKNFRNEADEHNQEESEMRK